ncbi:class I SAM-dependent methyltransferase [Microlunatus spumicola]|uniref:Class I SAM-dependent methyltransferase n=1 Tax=Microlunatus spumicola TaxID=81499 RepID=A0ABP6Y193_9ACTN
MLVPTFGAGGQETYARALVDGTAVLTLSDVRPSARPVRVPVARFTGPADPVDLRVLARARGPVLDVGCGPGRMVAAALRTGLPALGVDVSRTAVRLAHAAGLPVLRRSVFEPLPAGPGFGTVLLLDGNIGIGGSPGRLLDRCRALSAPGGTVLVEVDADPDVDHAFTGVLRSDDGGSSEPFPWAHVGRTALTRHATRAGLALVRPWTDEGRCFVELVRGA